MVSTQFLLNLANEASGQHHTVTTCRYIAAQKVPQPAAAFEISWFSSTNGQLSLLYSFFVMVSVASLVVFKVFLKRTTFAPLP